MKMVALGWAFASYHMKLSSMTWKALSGCESHTNSVRDDNMIVSRVSLKVQHFIFHWDVWRWRTVSTDHMGYSNCLLLEALIDMPLQWLGSTTYSLISLAKHSYTPESTLDISISISIWFQEQQLDEVYTWSVSTPWWFCLLLFIGIVWLSIATWSKWNTNLRCLLKHATVTRHQSKEK